MMRKMFSSVRLYVAVPKNPLHDLSIHIWSQQVGATMPSFSTPIKQAGEVGPMLVNEPEKQNQKTLQHSWSVHVDY